MLRRERVGDAVLAQIVADAHFSAETVSSLVDGHVRRVIRESVHQHRYIEAGEPYGIGDGALVAKIRQRDQDAVYLVTVLLEHLSTQPGLRQ